LLSPRAARASKENNAARRPWPRGRSPHAPAICSRPRPGDGDLPENAPLRRTRTCSGHTRQFFLTSLFPAHYTPLGFGAVLAIREFWVSADGSCGGNGRDPTT